MSAERPSAERLSAERVRTSWRNGFAPRLLVAQALVLLAGAMTSWLVASLVGPGIFHAHLVEAGVGHSEAETRHVEEAFGSALLISLGVALSASVLLALAVSAFFTRRLQRSTAAVARTASRITNGNYGSLVPSPGLGAEFDQIASTINDLSRRLGDVESTRRRLLADLAHEMRTPVSSIEAHLEAVEDGVRDLDRDTLEVLRGSTVRLQRLAEDLSAVARAEEGELDLRPVRTDARDLVRAAAAASQGACAERRVHLSVEADTSLDLMVDPDRLAQVIGNLLDNALRHTHEGGHIRLGLTRSRDGWVDLTVADDGDGISGDHLPHVFERFYRADPARSRARGGSGIGLTISRALVEAHGGTLTASSPGPGAGATFTVRLPTALPSNGRGGAGRNDDAKA